MELKDFIKHTLLDIVGGVEDANKEKNRFYLTSHKHHGTGESGTKVEFDVSVMITESSEKDAKGGIQVALVNLGGGVKTAETNQNVQKMKFEVFIAEK